MNTEIKGFPFQVWDYVISHGQLLIRSPRSSEQDFNLDILFVGVSYLEIPVYLGEFQFDEANFRDLEHLKQRYPFEFYASTKVFVLATQKFRYYIVAAHCTLKRNELEMLESPLQRKFCPTHLPK